MTGAMRHRQVVSGLMALMLGLFVSAPISAQTPGGKSGPLEVAPISPEMQSMAESTNVKPAPSQPQAMGRSMAAAEQNVSIIVKLENPSLAAYQGGVAGLAATNPQVTGRQLDVQSVESVQYLQYLDNEQTRFTNEVNKSAPDAQIVHQYQVAINGVSMVVPASQVGTIANLPGVEAVYPDTLQQLNTDISPGFIGADTAWKALGGQNSSGDSVLVGILDSGIWPEHPSFSDPDPTGKPYSPWSGGPFPCEFGNTAYNPNDAPFTCNNKLIGAYELIDTYKAIIGLLPTEFDSARDDNGHGTHTASTSAGNGDVEASIFGVSRGKVSGIAPRARIIAYRVCADQGCYQSDSIAAVEQAILDGVKVINFSISGGSNPYSDGVELAFLNAYAAGVFVAASAGNSGPALNTTDHRGPWVTTVAASNSNRFFVSTVTLTADNGDSLTLSGASVTDGIADADAGGLPARRPGAVHRSVRPGTFTGQIVICRRGVNARVDKGYQVAQGGAVGMLLYNPALQGLATDNHFIPSVHLENDAGASLLNFMSTHTGVMATFTAGTQAFVQGDVMAAFSSRGGPAQTLGISKPDVTAPGVQILAGHTPMPATAEGGMPGQLFQAIQGTSMSSPHVAGAAALLKAIHPDWTPGQIKSALMTSAADLGDEGRRGHARHHVR